MLLTSATKQFARVLTFMVLAALAGSALAQTEPVGTPCPALRTATDTYRTFYLAHPIDQNTFVDIQTALRNLLQEARIYGVRSRNAIVICGTASELQLAQKVISDLDLPRKIWRLTYTFTQTGSEGQLPPQRVTVLVAAGGEHTELKLGSRVPVVTPVFPIDGPPKNITEYKDIGLTLTATLEGSAEATELHTKIEQSAASNEKSAIGPQDPIIRQTSLEDTSALIPGKPQVLGSLDIPGANRREEISVTAEPIP